MPKMCTVATHAERGAPGQKLCRAIRHVVLRFECDGPIPPAFMNCPAGWTAIKCIPALHPLPVMKNNSVRRVLSKTFTTYWGLMLNGTKTHVIGMCAG